MRTEDQPSFDDVVRLIYEAALEPEGWQDAIEAAAYLLGAQSAMLLVADWSSGSYAPSVNVRHRIDADDVVRKWQADYTDHDLWSHAMRRLPPDFVTTGASVVDPRDLRRSPIYPDILLKAGMCDALSASLARADGIEVPVSFYSPELFERAQVALLERLAPHFRLAVRVQLQTGALQRRAAALEELVDRSSTGMLLLAEDGSVLWANREARVILDARDGLSLLHGRLRCARASDTRLLEAAVAAAGAGADSAARAGHALSIGRPSGLRPLGLLVAPRSESERRETNSWLGSHRKVAVVVTVSDPERRAELSAARIARLFGLTRAEARLAAAIASNDTLKDYAEAAGITIHTARWTLKRVLEKTGCRRQSDLVRLVLASPAALRRDPD